MSHILEIAEAERQRALAGGGVYGGGYAFPDQPPVLVFSGVKPAPETDAERIARLSRRVGELQYELDKARDEAKRLAGWFAPKGMVAEEAMYDGHAIPVAVTYEEHECDFGRAAYTRTLVEQVCIAGHWINVCELGDFGEALQSAKDAE